MDRLPSRAHHSLRPGLLIYRTQLQARPSATENSFRFSYKSRISTDEFRTGLIKGRSRPNPNSLMLFVKACYSSRTFTIQISCLALALLTSTPESNPDARAAEVLADLTAKRL